MRKIKRTTSHIYIYIYIYSKDSFVKVEPVYVPIDNASISN